MYGISKNPKIQQRLVNESMTYQANLEYLGCVIRGNFQLSIIVFINRNKTCKKITYQLVNTFDKLSSDKIILLCCFINDSNRCFN